jgi:signal transduction histidine kinase
VSNIRKARLLIVDDEPSVLETICAILAREGYDVAAASSVDEAIEHLRENTFAVALTDLRMEGASGLTLLSELRRRSPQTVTLVLTGYASLQSAIEALREGVYDYLIKPCDVEELKATVARAVERAALARALDERMAELDAANARLQSFNDELQRRVEAATRELTQKIDELDRAKQELEEEQRRRSEFISMIAHELGQPLTSLQSYAQLIARPNATSDARERARAAIVTQTERLARLIHDLSDAAQLSLGGFRVYLSENNVVDVVREQVEHAQRSTQQHTFALDHPPTDIFVTCDRDRIAQVLSNLLTNAMKHTPGGTIRVSLRQEADEVVVSIRDEGPGIPAEALAQIFRPGVRLVAPDSGKQSRGAGLGLFIAKGIVDAHGGRIWVESAVGRGATFFVSLSQASPAQPAVPEPASRVTRV